MITIITQAPAKIERGGEIFIGFQVFDPDDPLAQSTLVEWTWTQLSGTTGAFTEASGTGARGQCPFTAASGSTLGETLILRVTATLGTDTATCDVLVEAFDT